MGSVSPVLAGSIEPVYRPVVGQLLIVLGHGGIVASRLPDSATTYTFTATSADHLYFVLHNQSGAYDGDPDYDYPATAMVTAAVASFDGEYLTFPAVVSTHYQQWAFTTTYTDSFDGQDSAVPFSVWYEILPVYHPPPPPPPINGDDDPMTDPQLAAVFTNISASSAKVIASNNALADVAIQSIRMVVGAVLAVICAVSWKG